MTFILSNLYRNAHRNRTYILKFNKSRVLYIHLNAPLLPSSVNDFTKLAKTYKFLLIVDMLSVCLCNFN